MYIVVSKINNKIAWINNAPLSQNLKDEEVYFKFNKEQHRVVKCDNLPMKPFIVDGEIVRTMTLQEQVDEGYIELLPDQIIEDNKIRTMTDKEKVQAGLLTQQEYEDILWEQIRQKRNGLLFQCDWTRLNDVPDNIDKQAWKTYRQDLRDIPQTQNDPENIIWPSIPN